MDYEKGTKPKSQNPWHKKGILFLLFLFVGGLIVLVAMGIAQNRPLRENIKYGIVLDAGSSHTSLFVYKWPAEKQNDTGIVQQHHMCKVKGKGISSYFSEVEKAGLSLTICMDEAKSKIPKDRHKETPVYLGATAGMRLLRLESPTASDAVLNAVKKFLQTYPFSFSGARIITGQEEGAYGWITINYLLENFKQAFSAYYFVMNFLNVTNIQDPLTPALIQDTVEKFCKKPWETVKMEFPSIKEKYLSEYCFSGTYILSLLQDGYKFNTENWKNLKFLGKIGDSDAGWTLGYMLNLTNMIPAELPPSRPLSHGGYVALVVIFVLFLIIVLVIGYVCFRRNANKPTETV
nr:PREDICTED: ectonucleoside triphosphate diphosphohydrolase 1-like [Latimeria chalumnae]|eukprot:XP_006001882.1 PREDICTED: ectonucleoside triphosphate diphosphohydrolase 1-like [Latimeria chalumnae]